jgi:oligopeptide transport system ATP-binding protein
MSTLLEVKNLMTKFHTQEGTVHAVNGVSFEVGEGETLGIVGESGCGKSVTMLSLLGLIKCPPGRIAGGQALFLGRDLLAMPRKELQKIRGSQIGMIFQDPMTSLNPVLTIGKQIQEPLMVHMGMSAADADGRAVELLSMVGISDGAAHLADYPFQFSGGMRQRVMIAMAMACSPRILIADEATTALDVTIQAQVVELVKDVSRKLDTAVIWITHDLGVIAGIASRVAVMYAGFIVEHATVTDLYARPQHPYTHGLLGSLPRVDQDQETDLLNIEGMPPDLLVEPRHCPFAPRCRFAFDRCARENPALIEAGDGHQVACFWSIQEGKPRHGA